MAKPAAEKTPEKVKVLFIYKDGSLGGFASAYGTHEYEIPKDILDKYGKVTWKSEPDIPMIFQSSLIKRAREIFGL